MINIQYTPPQYIFTSSLPTSISIHISTLRKILSSPEPVDLTLWTRHGEIQHWHRCISLKYDFY